MDIKKLLRIALVLIILSATLSGYGQQASRIVFKDQQTGFKKTKQIKIGSNKKVAINQSDNLVNAGSPDKNSQPVLDSIGTFKIKITPNLKKDEFSIQIKDIQTAGRSEIMVMDSLNRVVWHKDNLQEETAIDLSAIKGENYNLLIIAGNKARKWEILKDNKKSTQKSK